MLFQNICWETIGIKRNITIGKRVKNVPFSCNTVLEDRLRSQRGADSCVYLCGFFKTDANFLTALPAKCLAQCCGSETVGALWLCDFSPDE